MGREAQPPHSRLTPRLEADLHRINFYRFCQLLEKLNPDRPLMGSTSHPGDDPVRFAPHPGMGFPASELKAVEYDEDNDSKPPLIRTTFMGMYGVDSPLPTAYLDDITQRREGHEALQGFLDIFSHRILTQFYRIWRKYSYPATFEPGGTDSISQSLLGLVGLGIPGTAEHIATPVSRFLSLLGVLQQPGKTQEGMQALVTLLAPDTTVKVSQLYRAEQQLTALGEVLQGLELKHLSQLDTLRTLMHNSAARLENSDGITSTRPDIQPGIRLPATAMNSAAASTKDLAGSPPEDTSASVVKWVYAALPEHQANAKALAAIPNQVKKWKFFAAGMCTMLVVSTVTLWSWQFLNRPVPLQTQLAASLAPLPASLTPEQLDMWRQRAPLPQVLITQTQQQLARLGKLPPDWNIEYSRQLLEQVRVLWPEQAKPLIQQWQQQLNAAALPTEQLNGWSQGMATLQKLSDRLNALDGQKGKYLTVSELKSVVFSAMQSFNQSIPAEEQLRVLSQNPAGEPLPAAARAQLEMHLKELIARYAEIKQDALK